MQASATLTSANTKTLSNSLKSFDADDEMVAPAIISALGNCYAQVKEYDKATEYLMKAAEKADNSSLSPLFLIQAGEIYEEQGKYDKALRSLQQGERQISYQSYQAGDIDKYIERATLEKGK
jgi:tetratricopeptide (TPR) repeat protein